MATNPFYDSFTHGGRLDKPIRIATDNIFGQMIQPEYTPVPPPLEGYFLLLDGTNFLLLDGENLTLL